MSMVLLKMVRPFVLSLIFTGGLLVACRPVSKTPQMPLITEPGPRPTPSPVAIAIPVDGLILNEDPPRTSLFNINTLAYELPGMDEVDVFNYTYANLGEQPLTVDIYYPPETPVDARLPVVIFGLGYRMSKERLRNAHFYTSWGRLVAAAGMIGVAYDTEQPDRDLEVLMAFLQDNAGALRMNPSKIGFHSSSANPPTVMSYLMQEGRTGIRFSIYYYGLSLTPDRRYTDELAQDCINRGCLVSELADVTYVDPEVALLVVKAGRDHITSGNEAMDHFIEYVRSAGATVTVLEYEGGRHGFDTQQKTDESAEIIAQTVAFMRKQFGLD
jgi:acetyl esterase/lipase